MKFLAFTLLIVLLSIIASVASYATDPPRIIFNILRMQVQLQALTNITPHVMEVVMSASDNGGYLAMGVAEGVMTGHLIGCAYPAAAGSTTGTCVEMQGDGYDVQNANSGTFSIVSVNNSGGKAMVVLRVGMSTMGVTAAQGFRRYIFARGEMKRGSLGGHDSNWSQVLVDLYGGNFKLPVELKWTYVTLFCTWLVSLLVALVGAALKTVHQQSGRTVSWTLNLITWTLLIACFAINIFESNSEFKKTCAPAPLARAVGIGACYVFSLIFFPTTRYFNIGYMAGSSFDRFISWHIIGGWVVYITLLVHLIWFFVVSASPAGGGSVGIIFSWKDGVQPVLPAFIGFIVFTAFFLFSVLRGKYYYYFRITHYFFPVFLIAFIIHFPPLGVCIAPGFLLWCGDFAVRWFGAPKEDPQITALEVDEGSKVTKMVVTIKNEEARKRWAESAHPGQYIFLSIPNISHLPHPFTFLNISKDGSEITFYIRSSGAFSGELYNLAKNSPNSLMNKRGIIRIFTGPIGTPEVDISYPTDVVFVSGGIGVTATAGLLYSMVHQLEEGVSNVRSISFVWCIREISFVKIILPHLEDCSKRLQNAGASFGTDGINFSVKIYLTTEEKYSDSDLGALTSNPNIKFFVGRRADRSDMEPLQTSYRNSVAFFSCGPESLMVTCRACASARGALLHEEVFSF